MIVDKHTVRGESFTVLAFGFVKAKKRIPPKLKHLHIHYFWIFQIEKSRCSLL